MNPEKGRATSILLFHFEPGYPRLVVPGRKTALFLVRRIQSNSLTTFKTYHLNDRDLKVEQGVRSTNSSA